MSETDILEDRIKQFEMCDQTISTPSALLYRKLLVRSKINREMEMLKQLWRRTSKLQKDKQIRRYLVQKARENDVIQFCDVMEEIMCAVLTGITNYQKISLYVRRTLQYPHRDYLVLKSCIALCKKLNSAHINK